LEFYITSSTQLFAGHCLHISLFYFQESKDK
jgi:hypothetical protein